MQSTSFFPPPTALPLSVLNFIAGLQRSGVARAADWGGSIISGPVWSGGECSRLRRKERSWPFTTCSGTSKQSLQYRMELTTGIPISRRELPKPRVSDNRLRPIQRVVDVVLPFPVKYQPTMKILTMAFWAVGARYQSYYSQNGFH